MKRNNNTYNTIFRMGVQVRIAMLIVMAAFALCSYAFPVEKYAASSRMASGKWVKIRIEEEGMQLLSNEQLRDMGFNDPSKVNVYGYGGRKIDEQLHSRHPDDLPLVPSTHTAKGIVFFGYGTVSWQYNALVNSEYSHEANPYSSSSYYFVSDVPVGEHTFATSDVRTSAAPQVTSFTERVLHEQDLYYPANTGRLVLGEDFRSTTNQAFNFKLPGNIGDASVTVQFGSKISTGTAALVFTANGQQLPASPTDKLDNLSSKLNVMLNTMTKHVDAPGSSLSLGIRFTSSGMLEMARLDFIRVEYPRRLALDGGELYFYLNHQADDIVAVSGVTADTELWDITSEVNPIRLTYRLDGDKAIFKPVAEGYREYVAYNPSAVSRRPVKVANVSNQDIHAMEVPDMVIITPGEYVSQAERIADMHRRLDGMVVYVLTPEVIYNEFSSGVKDVSAFRKLLKMWYDRSTDERRIGYCLLFARPTYDNRGISANVANGYPRLPIWQSPSSVGHDSFSTDIFIGQLEDCETAVAMSRLKSNVAIGRMPVKSLEEATQAADKLIKYVEDPDMGAWRNRVMIIADNADRNQHIQQAEDVYRHLRAVGNGESFEYNRLYLDLYPLVPSGTGVIFKLAHEKLLQAFDDGIMYMDYIGHASPSSWGHEGLMSWSDFNSLSNTRWPWILSATCEFTRWDADDVSGGEVIWLHPNAGVIGMFSTSREAYIGPNGVLNNSISDHVFERDANGNTLRVGDIFNGGLNGVGPYDTNKFRYLLIGDPAMRLPIPTRNVVVNSVNGADFTNADVEYPVLKAHGSAKIEGEIQNPDGSLDTGFNGVVEITIFDAERALETLGQSKDPDDDPGEPYAYNDHTNRLYTSRALVKDGKWEITAFIPMEIDNNYSPGLMTLYAYDENNNEANGTEKRFYIYGYDEDAVDDDDSPVITSFIVNNQSVGEGDLLSDSVMIYATFFDDGTGINTSSVTIGHGISLSVDGRKTYDLTSRFVADGPNSGSITFPLSGLEPGEHTLTLVVWDNANNSAEMSRKIMVAAFTNPSVYDITTNASPATTSVTFTVYHNQPADALDLTIDIFDMLGRNVWSRTTKSKGNYQGTVNMTWDLTDNSGKRVPRGIYIYRATITTADGKTATKSKKLAVTAAQQ